MIIQEILLSLWDFIFYCPKANSCWHGVNFSTLLFYLFLTSIFWAFVIQYFLWSHLNKNPDRKNRLVELTYGPYSHWMTEPVTQADFLIGAFPMFASGIWLCFWREWRGKPLPKLYYCPAVAKDQNYRRVYKEFPTFMRLYNFSHVLMLIGIASLLIGGNLP